MMMHDDDDSFDVPRRSFFTRFMAGFVGLLVGAIPLAASLGFLVNPLIRRRKPSETGGEGFVPLAIGPAALSDDGPPQAVAILADKVDAWNLYPQQPVGSVWLRRIGDEIIAFNTICPHLGCSVDYRASHGDFYCPCHLSNFNADGVRQNQIPPRDMDRLETRVVDGKIWVKFQNFRGGIADKIPV